MTRFNSYNKRSYFPLYSCAIIGITLLRPINAELTSLAKNDPYPIYSTMSIDDRFLLTKEQLKYKDPEWSAKKNNHVNISITPFGQNASRGKTIRGEICPPIAACIDSPTPTLTCIPCPDKADTPLGDLTGRMGMLTLLYGSFPKGVTTYPGGATGYLNTAFNALFGSPCPPGATQCPDGSPCTNGFCPPTTQPTAGNLNTEIYVDPLQDFGYFSTALEYRKRGIRFECDALFSDTFGIRIQAGVSSIRQVVESRTNQTPANESFPTQGDNTLSSATVNTYLMEQVHGIAKQIGTDIGDVIKTSAEEVRFNLFWRQAFDMNATEENSWTHFLLIPYCEVGGSFSPGKKRNPNLLYSLPFGNNTHPSVGFTTGLNLDFINTIEIGGEIGFTHFFKRNFCNYPVPTSQFQSTLFPFKADVTINPGNNWYFGGRLAAYHFLDRLSMFFEWFVLDHKQDTITLETPDPAFMPQVLERTTTFKTKFGNAGFNYDISHNINLGFLWQIPFSQRNAYRSSTIMAGINFTF